MSKQSSVRLIATKVVSSVVAGRSLSQILPIYKKILSKTDQPLLAELCYGTLRYYYRLNSWLNILINKPLKAIEQNIHSLLLIGLYQLFYTRIPAHAAINETVQVTHPLKKYYLRGFVNGVLRTAQRQALELQELSESNDILLTAHPNWFISKIQKDWPNRWQEIVHANNQSPPMTIRVNKQHITRNDYLKKLLDNCIQASASKISPQGIILEKAIPVHQLAGFKKGIVSVQDESAQLAGHILPAKPGERVLDACCAPGGKACQLLEMHSNLNLEALDINKNRLLLVQENFDRIGLQAKLFFGDACQPNQWWNGKLYDHILLDAPCTATGVIRRHPDIKLLCQPKNIDSLVKLQSKILHSTWSLCKPGGTLLYITCSMMPAENSMQIRDFLNRQNNAQLELIKDNWGLDTGFGRQILPGSGDGFFYSLLRKLRI